MKFYWWGKGAVMHVLYVLRECSLSHSPTRSTVQYIDSHPSPWALLPPKYHICSMRKKLYLKPPMECVVLFIIDDLFTMDVICWGWEKTPRNIQKKNEYENQGKNSPFGYPPIPPSTKWRPTVFQCPKTLKTSRTYPRWEMDPSLMGQKIQVGFSMGCWKQIIWFLYTWNSKIFNKSGLGLRLKK